MSAAPTSGGGEERPDAGRGGGRGDSGPAARGDPRVRGRDAGRPSGREEPPESPPAATPGSGGRDGPAVVEAVDVHREYRMRGGVVHAVRGVTLSVHAGDFLAITGPSGSGKSTLLHLLGAVDTPTRGSVRLGGVDVAGLSEKGRARLRLTGVGLVFQRFHLLPMLTARENVELPMAEAGAGREERQVRARELLERMGLGDRLDHRPGELSGGQRQRVAVARAVANRPPLLLADEPTGELDRDTGRGILELFGRLSEEGTAVVVATHDRDLAAGARRRVELVDGRLAGDAGGEAGRADTGDAGRGRGGGEPGDPEADGDAGRGGEPAESAGDGEGGGGGPAGPSDGDPDDDADPGEPAP